MQMLSNPRHERFAQYLAQGKTAAEAYELAGYKPNRSNAAQMAHKEHIKERLTQINAKLDRRTQITVETLIAEAEQVRVKAMESGQLNAANTAIKGKAVLTGKWIERAEIGGPGEFDHLTDDELERALVERLVLLGLLPAGTQH